MKISAICCTYNEEDKITALINSLKDCDEIIIADDNSTDKTREIASSMGAKVIVRQDAFKVPTEKNIEDFIEKFGYKPLFTAKDKFKDMGEIRNGILNYAKNDWVFQPDADEIVSWDFDEIQRLQNRYDHIECRLVHKRDPKGKPILYNNITKLFRKSMSKWKGQNHEVIVGTGKVRLIHASRMVIDHQQKPKDRSHDYLIKSLEYSISKEENPRDMLYLAREYFYTKDFGKAIKMFDWDIGRTDWLPEMAESFFFKAICLQHLKQIKEAEMATLACISLNPNMKKGFILMSEFTDTPFKYKWLDLADKANNYGVVFP
jgi:glycosyltransferase involved in cell wall biosynthesis